MSRMVTLAVSCLLLAFASLEEVQMPRRADAIADLMNRLEQDGLFNGVVLVAEQGRVVYRGAHGVSAFEAQTPLNATDRFEVGSISKPIAAVAIHQLVERGKISLNDALPKFFPALPYHSVTIGNLMSHTSGLFDVYEEVDMRKQFYAFYNKARPPYTNKDYLAYLEQYKPPLIGAPGDKDQYSNTAYVLLALIVEQVSGQPFNVYLKEHIFGPAGMKDSGVYSLMKDKTAARLVSGYMHDPLDGIVPETDPVSPPRMYGLTYGDDEMFTTVDDMLAFDRALRAGKMLEPETLGRLLVPATLTDGRAARYGQGFAITNIGGVRYIEHTGSTAGFWAYSKFSAPDNDNTVIVFTNVKSRRNTFHAVYTAINKILHDQPYDYPRASIIYPLAEVIEEEGASAAMDAFDQLNEFGEYLTLVSQLNGLGSLYQVKGRTEEARSIYELALKLQPDNEAAMEALQTLK